MTTGSTNECAFVSYFPARASNGEIMPELLLEKIAEEVAIDVTFLGGALIGRIVFPDWAMLRCVDIMHFCCTFVAHCECRD